jgi:hypothetical protein
VNLHLTTAVGGYVTVLPFMLSHYRSLGVSSMLVNVQAPTENDQIVGTIEREINKLGLSIASITVGPWHQVERQIYATSRMNCPNDWFILADQDEFHRYPRPLSELIDMCESKGYDYVVGAFVDRIGTDGVLAEIDPDQSLEAQFPLGAFLSYPIAGADPRKVVLAKGHVQLTGGQHQALTGRPCPITEAFVQVHHFKWVSGLLSRMTERARYHSAVGVPHWIESERVASYLKKHAGRINIAEPQFVVAPANPEYSRWPELTELALHFAQNGVEPPKLFV